MLRWATFYPQIHLTRPRCCVEHLKNTETRPVLAVYSATRCDRSPPETSPLMRFAPYLKHGDVSPLLLRPTSPGAQPRGRQKPALELAVESQLGTQRCGVRVMKPYTCLWARMDVAALTKGNSLCRGSLRLGWKRSRSCPLLPGPTTLTSGEKATLRTTTCRFFFSPPLLRMRRAQKCCSAPLCQNLRQPRNGPSFPFLNIIE